MWQRVSERLGGKAARSPIAPDPLAELARQAGAGEEGALRHLLVTLAPHLLRVARRALGRAHPEVQDVAQEAAWALVKALPRFRGDSTVTHFACRIALLTALKVRRREAAEGRRRRALQRLGEYSGAAPSSTPHTELLQARCVEALRELLGRLPSAQAEAVGLHHVVGLTATEIASLTGAPLQTVKTRLKRGRKDLRQAVLAETELETEVGVRHGLA